MFILSSLLATPAFIAGFYFLRLVESYSLSLIKAGIEPASRLLKQAFYKEESNKHYFLFENDTFFMKKRVSKSDLNEVSFCFVGCRSSNLILERFFYFLLWSSFLFWLLKLFNYLETFLGQPKGLLAICKATKNIA